MKNTYLLLFILFFKAHSSFALDPTYQWAKEYKSRVSPAAVATDAVGNIYVTGGFSDTTDMDPGPGVFSLISAGSIDFYVMKLDPSGNLIWAKSLGGSGYDLGTGIALDNNGNIYLTGGFIGTIDFDFGPVTFNLTSVGDRDIFISKLDQNGNFIWAKGMGGAYDDFGSGLTLGTNGDIIITGIFKDTVDFNPGAAINNLIGAGIITSDIFISSFDASGNFLWAKKIGSNSNEYSRSIEVDYVGNIYLTGHFFGTADFDPGAPVYNLTATGNWQDIFILKLTSTGNFIWAKRIGASNTDIGTDIKTDRLGNIFITGIFFLTVDFDPNAGIYNLTSAGNEDAFVCKLDSSGNFIWARQFGGTAPDGASAIALDVGGNVYTIGHFRTTADFDPGVGTYILSNAGQADAFLCKLNSNGDFVWAHKISGTDEDIGSCINVDPFGSVVVSGNFEGTTNFNFPSTANLTTDLYGSMFMAKYSQCANASIQSVSACNYFTWIDGNTYTSNNNTAIYTLTNSASCDSTIRLNLTVSSNSVGTDVITSCNSYTWIDGITYPSSNTTATFTLPNAAGCDSIIALQLTIANNSSTQTVFACNSFNWINGITYTSSTNSASYTLINAAGCDSVVSLNLTIGNNASVQTVAACSSFTWIDGITYTSSNNSATHTLTNAAGCDSVVTLNLSINNNSSIQTVSACSSYTWIDGITYTANNTSTTFTLTNAAGCDSVVTLHLTINTFSSTQTVNACNSFTWINGVTYTNSNNTATYLLSTAGGCDSLVTLNLSINSSASTQTVTACDTYTWLDGNIYTSSNVANYTLTNAAGCDSVITLNLTINQSSSINDIITACEQYTWINGLTYTSSNFSAITTLTTSSGCDSIIHLNLTIHYNTNAIDAITACDSIVWLDGNTYSASNNTATFNLPNAVGCDSIISLALTINSNSSIQTVNACSSYTWIDGITYTTSNSSATYTYTNSAGCDSTVTLHLTINNNSSTQNVIACDSYTWINGVIYDGNTTATQTLTNSAGCDSVVTLVLTIYKSTTGSSIVNACDSYTWIDGNTYTSSSSNATYLYSTAAGCDSLVTLILTINKSSSGIDSVTSCNSYTWIDGTTYTASNSTAEYTLTNSMGCDSLIRLNLTINTADATFTQIENSLTANALNEEYQWLTCNNGFAAITGETASTYLVTANGDYALAVNNNGCRDTSDCSYASANSLGNSFLIYPNPSKGKFLILVGDKIPLPATARIYDELGKKIKELEITDSKTEVEIVAANALYFFSLKNGKDWLNQKIEIQK
ncbi:MAG: SBBP repeat-containing protein [Bacteroidetes bacterium]|nr:SBBP repeat-containing protein [Bacteroidota bacterium]